MFRREKQPEAEAVAADKTIWLSKAACCVLIGRGQEFFRRNIQPALSPSETRRCAGRGKPLEVDARAAVKVFVSLAVVNDDALLDGPDSPSLERFRRLRGDEIELRLLRELGELQSVSLTRAWMTEAFQEIGNAITEIAKLFGPRAGKLVSRAAIRAGKRAVARHYPPGWKSRIALVSPDQKEVAIEFGPWADFDWGEDGEEEREYSCPTCSGRVSGTWTISPDGQETPVWRCATINCQWTAPRLRQSEAEARNGSDHDQFTIRPDVQPALDEPHTPETAEEAPA